MTPILSRADLTRAIERIVVAYQDMLHMPPNAEETKALTAHQAACRAALAHIEHLLKVARLLGSDGDDAPEDLSALIARAESAVSQGAYVDAEDTSA